MPLKDKIIFLVEDDAVSLSVIRMLLQKEGARVPFDHLGSRTIEQLLEILSTPAIKIDLILLDLKLPYGVSGYDLLKAIRATPGLVNIPVVAFTAADPETEIPKAKAAGFTGYITKPIDRSHFIQDLGLILDGRPVWRSVR